MAHVYEIVWGHPCDVLAKIRYNQILESNTKIYPGELITTNNYLSEQFPQEGCSLWTGRGCDEDQEHPWKL